MGTPTPAAEIMERGIAAEATLPGHVALSAASMVAEGRFQNMGELVLTAVMTYLDLSRHPDVLRYLDESLIEEAIESPSYGIPPNQAVADIMRKLKRREPMPAREAVRSLLGLPAAVPAPEAA